MTTRLQIVVAMALALVLAEAARGPRAGAAEGPGSVPWARILTQPADWYGSVAARRIAMQVVAFQYPEGGWPKNIDMARPLSAEAVAALRVERRADGGPTIDNGATWTQLRFLAAVVARTGAPELRRAVEQGLDYLLRAQYPDGGWPQFYPDTSGYRAHVTFNDDAMTRVVELMRDVAWRRSPFGFVDDQRTRRAEDAFRRAVTCILRCQVVVEGRRTAWCAQHDHETLAPAPARSFEPVSLSGRESVGILELLMSFDDPSPDLVAAVDGGVAWLRSVGLHGLRVVTTGRSGQRDQDRVTVADPSAPALWARFYEIGTNRPLFAGRDGALHGSLNEIERERRIGYAYLGAWPEELLARSYPAWRSRRDVKAARVVAPSPPGRVLRIALVGDSTVTDDKGWGAGFARLLAPGVDCVNQARSGRSSRSYLNEGHWKSAIAQHPDYLLIQFGHNDMPGKGADRETDPSITYRDLLTRYVDETRAAGVRLVLVTPMTRRGFQNGRVIDDLLPYAEAMQKLAAEKSVPLVDLHARSLALVEKLGPVAAGELGPLKEDGTPDRTHLNAKGSDLMARLIVSELRKAVPELAPWLKAAEVPLGGTATPQKPLR